MLPPISSAISIPSPDSIRQAGDATNAETFRHVLGGAIENLDKLRNDAGQAVERFLSGGGEELHSIALSAQRAELAFELGLQVRNKVVQAYQEIMRMQF